jgi:TolB-like protein
MKNLLKRTVSVLFVILTMASCVSLQDRAATESQANQVIGNVEVEFASFQFMHIQNKNGIKQKAYTKLLEEAKNIYGENTDIRNIVITSGFSGFEAINILATVALGLGSGVLMYNLFFNDFDSSEEPPSTLPALGIGLVIGAGLSGNTQKITARGDVIAIDQTNATSIRRASKDATTGIEGAINRACANLIKELPANTTIAVISISSNDRDTAVFVVDELEYQIVDSKKFKVVDRKTLDTIRTEQNFQMSGDVSDASAVSIGQMLGANIVLTGSITGTSSTTRLSIKALDVKTAQIVTMAREAF